MPSLERPTILHYITEWVGLDCGDCGLPIRSVLVRRPPEARNGELVFPGSITDLCDICQRRSASAEMAGTIAAELEACFVARMQLLGERHVARALGLARPMSVTLFRITGYHHHGNRPLEGPRDPRATMYTLQGRGPHIPKTYRAAKAIGPYPPHMIHFPDASGFPGAAFVVIGADVWDPRFPDARVEMLPRPGDLTAPFDVRVVEGDDLGALDRAEFMHTAVSMFGAAEMAVTRGRKLGSGSNFETREDCEAALVAAIQELLETGQRVSKAAIGRYIGRTYRPSRPDDDPELKDPGKNVARWEVDFGIDVNALIERERRRHDQRKPRH
jgi:hypothetical protein